MKYGRYTPAREQRPVTVVNYGEPASCCLSLPRHAVKASVLDERFRAKYGRYSPTEERRLKTNGEEVAMHHSRCIGLGRCALAHKQTAARKTPIVTDSEARFWAKYGRSRPASERGPPR